MLKIKRVADGVLFPYNGPHNPVLKKVGFVLFDDSVPESEPETTGQKLVVDDDAPVFPTVDKKPKPTGLQPPEPEKEPAGDYVGQPEKTPLESEIEKLKGMKKRGSIGAYVKETYKVKIEKMNRKTSDILEDAIEIVKNNFKE